MKYTTTICFLLFLISNASSQSKGDYTWIWGGGSDSMRNDAVVMMFKDDDRQVSRFPIDLEGLTSQINASISDESGDLIFYTNGCKILNKDYTLMEGGDSINYGEWYDFNADCEFGYTGPQSTFIVPAPGKDDHYYVITKPIELIEGYESAIGAPTIWYTEVDMSANDGLGKVVKKDVEVFRRDNLLSGYNHVIQHENGEDWWFFQIRDTTNIYYSFLIDGLGPRMVDSFALGPQFHHDSSAAGQAKFSADGQRFALVNIYMGLMVYDFDRATGRLSNLRQMPRYREFGLFNGLEWSANGRFIYVSQQDSLFQIDTDENDLLDGQRLIGIWDGTSNPFATSFNHMMRGPDCRIYMSSASSTKTLHVINQPDELGADCDFRQHGLDLLNVSTGTISMPNFPNFRIDTGPVCNPDIMTMVDHPLFELLREMRVYPNPSSHIIHMDLDDRQDGFLYIYDERGGVVHHDYVSSDDAIGIDHLPQGIYIIRLITKEGRGYQGRFVRK